VAIDRELCAFCIKLHFNIFSFQTFADEKGLAEQVNIAMRRDLTEEGDASCCDLQRFGGNDIVEWQFADLDPFAMLGRCQATELRLRVLGIDGLLQAMQLAAQSADPRVVPLEQAYLEPPVVILDTVPLCWG
jgi:hypothetical protein